MSEEKSIVVDLTPEDNGAEPKKAEKKKVTRSSVRCA